jgi:hypothetical protein
MTGNWICVAVTIGVVNGCAGVTVGGIEVTVSAGRTGSVGDIVVEGDEHDVTPKIIKTAIIARIVSGIKHSFYWS